MDPLKTAVARKGWDKSKWTSDEEGPVLAIDMGGPRGDEDSMPDDADDVAPVAPKAFSMPGDEEGGFGGEEYGESESEALGDDDGPMSPEEMQGADIGAARKRFMEEKAAGQDAVWDDPYDPPSEEEEAADWAPFVADKAGHLERFGASPEELAGYAKKLQEQGIDPSMVSSYYLKTVFGLPPERSTTISYQLNEEYDPGETEPDSDQDDGAP